MVLAVVLLLLTALLAAAAVLGRAPGEEGTHQCGASAATRPHERHRPTSTSPAGYASAAGDSSPAGRGRPAGPPARAAAARLPDLTSGSSGSTVEPADAPPMVAAVLLEMVQEQAASVEPPSDRAAPAGRRGATHRQSHEPTWHVVLAAGKQVQQVGGQAVLPQGEGRPAPQQGAHRRGWGSPA